jgi:hypothetical protein
MTFIASLTMASSGMPLACSTLSPKACAFLTSAALSAEKMVHSFSQKLFSFFFPFAAGLAGGLAAGLDADLDANFAAELAGRHCVLPHGRDEAVQCREEMDAAVYIGLAWLVRRSAEEHALQTYLDWCVNGSIARLCWLRIVRLSMFRKALELRHAW